MTTFRIADDDTIYLDHAATTPVDPVVVDVMLPYFTERFGNPSSIYRLGQEARAALDDSRASVARVLVCQPREILFTSGATESDNTALKGVAWAARLARQGSMTPPHIVTTAIEHHAVLHAAEALREQGFDLTIVPCDRFGMVCPATIEAAIRPETCLISVMYANNEVGSVQPISAIATIAREHHILMHTDAAQAAGQLPLRVDELGVDLLTLSAHKFYGPKGVGVLYVRRGTPISFQQSGGGQEEGRRGGTENVAFAVGLAVALERAEARRPEYAPRFAALRDRLWEGISAEFPGATINGPIDRAQRLPNNLSVVIPGVQGETMLLGLDMEGVAASAGSACTTGNTEPSHVLRAMALDEETCRSTLRFTVGRDNTEEEIDDALQVLSETVARVRGLAGVA